MIDATAMGFTLTDTQRAAAILESVAAPDGAMIVAMDLARFCMIPLDEAAMALAVPRKLGRLGFDVWATRDVWTTVGEQVAGQAEAYTHTIHGRLDIAAAKGQPWVDEARRQLDRIFGPR